MTCRPPRLSRPRITTFAALLAAGTLTGLLLGEGRAAATDYYVAPTGSDSNPGTMAEPFLTVQKGANTGVAGDTVWFRAGTYKSSKQITFSKSGTSDTNRINYFAYTGEIPVFDFSTYVSPNTAVDEPTIVITGSWLHFKGLEVANGAVQPSGSHSNDAVRATNTHDNIFELLNIHNNFGPGLFINGGTGGHLILNCDSHDNYDKDGSQGDGQNGDGFGVHYQTTGPSTILRGNRSWINSDDGYDLISQEVPVTIENCWAVMNGYINGGASKPSEGNGNGFKAGSSQTGIRHLLQNNVAWKNSAAGFYANHSTGGNTWYNNTSYMNGVQYNMLASSFDSSGNVTGTITLTGSKVHIMRNNIGFPNSNSNMGGVDTSFNTWDLGITPAAADFASTSDSGYMGARQADGSLPNISFMHLTAGSPMIDKGTNVGLPYVGAAPDLGAYEYGATGGTSGTGGGTGTGGSTGSTGGTTGSTGGTTGSTGGATGTGGKAGTGGAVGTGGKPGTGGITGGTGGSVGTGGTTAGTGGTTAGTGGTTGGAGGNSGTGGAIVTTGSGGGTSTTGTGGSGTGTGGSVATGSGGSTSTTGTGGSGETGDGSASGCSCDVSPSTGPAPLLLLAGFAAFGLRRRRGRSRR